MKLLPEPGWRRLTSLVIFAALLTFLTITCLYTYLLVNESQIILNINHDLSFHYLGLTKKLILEKTVNGNSVYFYSDSFNGKPIEITNEVYLYPILKEAYGDFEEFIAKKHNLKKPARTKRKKIKIIFVRQKIHQAHDLAHQEPLSAAFAEVFSRKIYIKVENKKNGKYNVLEEKNVLCHEIFHILSGEYTLWELAPHNDAYEFGNLK